MLSESIAVSAASAPHGSAADGSTDFATTMIICCAALLGVSTVAVVARVASRTVMTDWRLGWDDYAIILALLSTSLFTALAIQTTNYGLGKHIWNIPSKTYDPYYIWFIMAIFASCPLSHYFVKISILFMYLRIFQLKTSQRYMVYALFAYCTAYYWAAFGSIVGVCSLGNASGAWWGKSDPMGGGHHKVNCLSYGRLSLVVGGLDLLGDAMVLLFPIPLVLRLKISGGQRVYLLIVFLCGFCATAACAVRVAFIAETLDSRDITLAQSHIVTLFIEHNLAILAACTPTLGPIFRYLRPSAWQHQHLSSPTNLSPNTLSPTTVHEWPLPAHRLNRNSRQSDKNRASLTGDARSSIRTSFVRPSTSRWGSTIGRAQTSADQRDSFAGDAFQVDCPPPTPMVVPMAARRISAERCWLPPVRLRWDGDVSGGYV